MCRSSCLLLCRDSFLSTDKVRVTGNGSESISLKAGGDGAAAPDWLSV